MKEHDLVIIGGGPAGYTAAIRARQLGIDTACIEREAPLGGTCLRVGCIPSKAMLEASELYFQARNHFSAMGIQTGDVKLDLPTMLARKEGIVSTLSKGIDGLFRKHKITRYFGHAALDGPGRVVLETKDGKEQITAKNILIATGSKPASLPGIELDGNLVGTSTEALSYKEVPKHLVVVGGGYIGLELGSVWGRLGSKVTVLEFLDRILPGTDSELAKDAQAALGKQGLEFRLKTRVVSAKAVNGKCVVEVAESTPIECDRVLVAVGRIPNTERLGLGTAAVQLDEKGRIIVNDSFETTCPGVYAVGDVIAGPMLAHKAEEEAVACIERLVTGYGHVDYSTIPSVIFLDPEIAAVGKTEDQLIFEKIEYRKGVFPFRANGRARTLGQTEGKVKMLADKFTDRILGVHIMGPRAGDLIAEATAAMAFGASSEDVARLCHAHPTLPEAIKEAALSVDGRPLSI